MKADLRRKFDELVEGVIASLPAGIRELIEEVPIIVLDRPTPEMLRDLGIEEDGSDDGSDICGLHTGTMLTQRSIEMSGELPEQIHLFRVGTVSAAGGWKGSDARERIAEEIRVTILHEIGHHFGLEEEDLSDLGYD